MPWLLLLPFLLLNLRSCWLCCPNHASQPVKPPSWQSRGIQVKITKWQVPGSALVVSSTQPQPWISRMQSKAESTLLMDNSKMGWNDLTKAKLFRWQLLDNVSWVHQMSWRALGPACHGHLATQCCLDNANPHLHPLGHGRGQKSHHPRMRLGCGNKEATAAMNNLFSTVPTTHTVWKAGQGFVNELRPRVITCSCRLLGAVIALSIYHVT